MNHEQLKAMFDQQAPSYDQQWSKLAAFRDGLHMLIGSIFSELPISSRVLCVGAGTGAEMIYLAQRFPHWAFTAVEPSVLMLNVCRRRAEEHGFAARCSFHEGYLDSLPSTESFDAATCLLVSQFLVEQQARSNFFRTIAQRLQPNAILASPIQLPISNRKPIKASLMFGCERWRQPMSRLKGWSRYVRRMDEMLQFCPQEKSKRSSYLAASSRRYSSSRRDSFMRGTPGEQHASDECRLQPPRTSALVSGCLAALGWGLTGTFVKLLPNFTTLEVLGLRLTIAFLIALPILVSNRLLMAQFLTLMRTPVGLDKSSLMVFYYLLAVRVFQLAPVSDVVLIIGLSPLIGLAVKSVMKKPLMLREGIGALTAFGDLILFVLPKLQGNFDRLTYLNRLTYLIGL